MSKAIGLAGMHTGEKAHAHFMYGHSDAFCGRARRTFRRISKACQKAYDAGWERGLKDKKEKSGNTRKA